MLGEPSFYGWRREIAPRDRERAAARQQPALVPVAVVAAEPLEVVVRGGRVVRAGVPAPGKPRFDKSDLELRYRGRLLMEVPARAEYRIIVLSTYQDLRWCRRILDPLPGGHPDPKKRLENVVRGLNTNQIEWLLNFELDGGGIGIRWAPVFGSSRPSQRRELEGS